MKRVKINRWTAALAAAGFVSTASVASAQSSGTVTNSATATNSTVSTVAATNSTGGFFTRFDKAMREQLGEPAYEAPATNAPPPHHRGHPTPFDSPPYPTGDWQIGGTPIIGDENALPTYPLTEAMWGIPTVGDAMKNNRINLYGWEDISGNISSSHNTAAGPNANFPMAYDSRPEPVGAKSRCFIS